jgi:hypothetical protein
LASDLQAEAEACFLKAIEIVQKQQAKPWELRATVSLAQLWQRQALEQGAGSEEHRAGSKKQGARNTHHVTRNRLDEAHQRLSAFCSWFTEGFVTKDWQAANALLDSLGASV